MQHTIQIHTPPATPDGYAQSRYGQLLTATLDALLPGQQHCHEHGDSRPHARQLYATNDADSTKRAAVYQDGAALFVLYTHDISWDEGEEWAAEGFEDADSARQYADELVR